MCADCCMIYIVYLLSIFHRRLILLDFWNHQIKHLISVIVFFHTIFIFFLLFNFFFFLFQQHIYFNLFIVSFSLH